MTGRDLALSRRKFLGLFGGGAAAAWLGPLSGCSFYAAESGPAFEPWNFPEVDDSPAIEAARAAILAASPHNTQPWRMRVEQEQIELHADLTRHLGSMDGLRRELYIGLGCALENLMIAAQARGARPALTLLPDPADPSQVARVALRPGSGARESRGADALYRQIALRHTNRGAYLDGGFTAGLASRLHDLVGEESGLRLHLLTSSRECAAFREQTIAATRAIIDDAEMSADSDRWYRHTQAEIERARDGVTLDATGSGATTRFLGKSFSRPDTASANAYWLDATRERQLSAACFGMISSSRANTRAEQLQTGRAFQRLQLWAASEGLAMQPLNQLAERQDREQTETLKPVFSRALEDLMGAGDRRTQILFRIGYPLDEALASPRRPLAWVLL
jgi:nitroreductase